MIVGNHKPTLHTVDEAARRRFNIVPFTRIEVLSRLGTTEGPKSKDGQSFWRCAKYYLAVVAAGAAPYSHDANIDALKHTRRAAMQNSWIWALLLAMALCAALAFFLIEVWQLVEFVYR
jgi:hypothetical protein